MIHLFNKTLYLLTEITEEKENYHIAESKGLITATVTVPLSSYQSSKYFGCADIDNPNNYLIYYILRKTINGNYITLEGVHKFFDDLKGKVIKDKRPQDSTLANAMSIALNGSSWSVGTSDVVGTKTTNYYQESVLDAFNKNINLWNCDFEPIITFTNGKIVSQKVNFYQNQSKDYGKWYEYADDKLVEIIAEEDNNIFTAFVGRGSSLPITDKDNELTGGYTRKTDFENVVWTTPTNPVNKPLGQNYVEIASATELYGYPDGTPKIGFVEFDIEDPKELLNETYKYAVDNARPKLQLKSVIKDNNPIELNEVCTVIRDDIGIRYKTKVIKLKRDFISGTKEFEFGDRIISTQANIFKDILKSQENIRVETNSKLKTALDTVANYYFNEDGYNYELKVGNEYGLPAGYYSFDKPIDQNPTKVIYVGAGKMMIANSKNPDGTWHWTTAIDGDGIYGSTIIANSITANKLAPDVGQILDIESNAAIRARVTKEEIKTDPEIQDALRGLPGVQGPIGPKGDAGVQGPVGPSGKGISNTTFAYAMSASGTISPTTWLSNPPTPIKGQYIWTQTTLHYTDGTSKESYSVSYIGVDGAKGDDGAPGKEGTKILSTTVTYAVGSSGTSAPTSGWVTSPPATQPGQYLWTKFVWAYSDSTNETGYSVARHGATGPQGPQGIQGPIGLTGPQGPSGKPSYLWKVYADDDKGTGITTNPSGKRWLGLRTTETPPPVVLTPSLYDWSPLFDNVQVGGTNLILKSNAVITSTLYNIAQYDLSEELVEGQQYTLTVYGPKITGGSMGLWRDSGNVIVNLNLPYNIEKGRYELTFICPKEGTNPTKKRISLYNYPSTQNPKQATINFAKLEKGNVATDYSENLQDIENRIIENYQAYADKKTSDLEKIINADLVNIKNQVDGKVEIFYGQVDPTLTNTPASAWTTPELKTSHQNDMYFNKVTGIGWLFTGTAWEAIKDADVNTALNNASKAQTTADNKSTVFVSQPVPPYKAGDLWAQGTAGELMQCKVTRLTGTYVAADWAKAVKYTDDSLAVGLRDFTNVAFKDGVVSRSEAVALKSYIDEVSNGRTDVAARYATIVADSNIPANIKTNLQNKKLAFDSAYDTMILAINNRIADGVVTPTERNEINQFISSYQTALKNLTSELINSQNEITALEIKQESDRLSLDFDFKVKDLKIATEMNGDNLIDQAYVMDGISNPFALGKNDITLVKNPSTNDFDISIAGTKTVATDFIPYNSKNPYYYNIKLFTEGLATTTNMLFFQIRYFDANKNSLGTNDLATNFIPTQTLYGQTEKEYIGFVDPVPSTDPRYNAVYIRLYFWTRYPGSTDTTSNTIYRRLIVKQLNSGYDRTGVISFDRDGMKVENSYIEARTRISADGLQTDTLDGKLITSVGADGVITPVLFVDKLYSNNVVGKVGNNPQIEQIINLYISPNATGDGSGKDASNKANNIHQALNLNVFEQNNRYLDYVTINIYIDAGTYNENVSLVGISGFGNINFIFNSTAIYWNGLWAAHNVEPRITLSGSRATFIKRSIQNDAFLFYVNNASMRVISMNLDGYDTTTKQIGHAVNRGYLEFQDCDLARAPVGMRLEQSFGQMINCKGNIIGTNMIATASIGSLAGTRPVAPEQGYVNSGVITDSNASQVPSAFAKPVISWKTTTKTFVGRLYSIGYNGAYDYPNLFVQGNYQNYYYVGTADFGKEIKDWLSANGGYQSVTGIYIKYTRNSSGYGSASPVIASPGVATLTSIAQGAIATSANLNGTALGNAILNNPTVKLQSATNLGTSAYMKLTSVSITITCQKQG